MTKTIPTFNAMLRMMGSDVTYHREHAGTVCPCVSPEGFRDPSWHADPAHASAPVCNEDGFLPGLIENTTVKAVVQPATIGQRGRAAERVAQILGEIQRDDHYGVFPCEWQGTTLDLAALVDVASSFIVYDNRRFVVVAADKIPDVDGDPNHHWEVGLRLVHDRTLAPSVFPEQFDWEYDGVGTVTLKYVNYPWDDPDGNFNANDILSVPVARAIAKGSSGTLVLEGIGFSSVGEPAGDYVQVALNGQNGEARVLREFTLGEAGT